MIEIADYHEPVYGQLRWPRIPQSRIHQSRSSPIPYKRKGTTSQSRTRTRGLRTGACLPGRSLWHRSLEADCWWYQGLESLLDEVVRITRPGGLMVFAESCCPWPLIDPAPEGAGSAFPDLMDLMSKQVAPLGMTYGVELAPFEDWTLPRMMSAHPGINEFSHWHVSCPFHPWPTGMSLPTSWRPSLTNRPTTERSRRNNA